MDIEPGFQITAAPRPVSPDHDPSLPVSVMVESAIREWFALLQTCQSRQKAAIENENEAWITLSNVWFSLTRICERVGEAAPELKHSLQIVLNNIEDALFEAGLELVAAEGEVYSDDLADVLENIDQVYRDDVCEPIVYEIITPALKRQNELIRMGKAVIALPAKHE